MRSSIVLAVLCGITVALSGCTLTRGITAWAQSNASFSHCTSDPRILCEPGSENLAESIAPLLPQAIATVEQAQFSRFRKPILVQTYATRESFSRASGAPGYAEGAVSLSVLHLSPKLLSTPERTRGILTHEVSHLHLLLKLGSLNKGTIPAWFDEGLATYVSDGGGAETVSPASAIEALRHGRHFEPDASQQLLFPKNAASYGLTPHMFYRQSALFVAYMHDSNPAAFEQMIKLVAARRRWPTLSRPPISSDWLRFGPNFLRPLINSRRRYTESASTGVIHASLGRYSIGTLSRFACASHAARRSAAVGW